MKIKINFSRALLCLTFAVGLGMVLGLGSSLQLYAFSLLTSNEVSIYSSAYGDNLVQFPSLQDWIVNEYLAIFTVVAGLYYMIMRRNRYPREIFLFGLVYFFFAHSIVDLYFSYTNGDFSGMSQSLVANVIGAPLISGYILLVLSVVEYAAIFSNRKIYLKNAFIYGLPVFIGFLVSSAAYYICATFFNPTPSKVELIAERPLSLTYWSNKKRKATGQDTNSTEAGKFNFFANAHEFKGDVSAMNAEGALQVKWLKGNSAESEFRVKIKLFDGCDNEISEKIWNSASVLSSETLQDLQISFDSGYSSIQFGKKVDNKILKIGGDDIVEIWLKDGSKGKMDVTRLTRKSRIEYYSPSGETNFVVSAWLAKQEKSKFLPTVRTAKIKLNGKQYNISLDMDERRFDGLVGCQALNIKTAQSKQIAEFSKLSGIASIGVEITPVKRNNFDEPVSSFAFENLNGFLYVNQISSEDLARVISDGSLRGMQVRGEVKGFRVNGVSMDSNSFETYTIMDGLIKGESLDSGKLRFFGSAHSLYREQVRLNLTRWERMDSSVKMILLSAIAAMFSSLFWKTGNILQKNEIFRRRVLQ